MERVDREASPYTLGNSGIGMVGGMGGVTAIGMAEVSDTDIKLPNAHGRGQPT